MADSEINITYETLFDLLRREKNHEELQKLPDNYYENVTTYLRDKFAILEESKKIQDSFSSADHEKTSEDILSIRKVLKELYNRREKKIVKVALDTAMINAPIADTDSMMDYELELYNKVVRLFKQFRSRVLMNLLDAKEPGHLSGFTDNGSTQLEEQTPPPKEEEESKLSTEEQTEPKSSQITPETPKEETSNESSEEEPENSAVEEQEPDKPESLMDTQEENQEDSTEKSPEPENSAVEEQETIKILFLADIPKFVGRELEVYGPFNKEETFVLPKDIANILIEKGRAKEI